VHGMLRRYGGWFDGNPSHLFPSRTSAVAKEVAALAGAPELLRRARALQQAGEVQLALHLVDFVIDSDAPEPQHEALQLKSHLLAARAAIEPSFIARNIFRNGATAAAEQAKE
jgi:alkyl sulfatase BDS1-like metallo-beta-lactamase superfamily hydrolase